MRNNLKIEELEQTATFRNLVAKKEIAQANMISTRSERAKILNAYLVHRNKGVIPTTVSGNSRLIVLDLIEMDNQDASYRMTSEQINRLNP